jgi:hypothetical protein
MMYYLLFSLLGIFYNPTTSTNYTETRKLANFEEIEVQSVVKLIYSEGPTFLVKVETDNQEIAKLIETNIIKNKLVVGVKKTKKSAQFKVLNVYVTAPKVKKFSANSASKIDFKTVINQEKLVINLVSASNASGILKSKSIVLNLSSASEAHFQIESENSNIIMSGASSLEMKGTVQKNKIQLSGSSVFYGQSLNSKETKVICSGASLAKINCTEILEATASGSSDIQFWGKPNYKSILKKEASSIIKK